LEMAHAAQPERVKLEDSNIALFGSDIEKKIKKDAAGHEPAWVGAGKKVGVEVWRIENFKVHRWPEKQYGEFFDGDAYIILHTYVKPEHKDKLCYTLYFWIGQYASQDEYGTAAYKTVELDNVLDGKARQHRVCQGHEGKHFLALWRHPLVIKSGGVASGFHHVEAEKFVPHLLHFKGKGAHIKCVQVPAVTASLNHQDVFVLDCGLRLYQWNGRHSTAFERSKAGTWLAEVKGEREAHSFVLESDEDNEEFWKILGGKAGIRDAPAPEEEKKAQPTVVVQISADGKINKIAEGADLSMSLLRSSHVFLVSNHIEVFVWVGSHAPVAERSYAMKYGIDFLKAESLPFHTPIARVVQGHEPEEFHTFFPRGGHPVEDAAAAAAAGAGAGAHH